MPSPRIGLGDASRFWDDFERDVVPNLVELHIAGGEPLIIAKHYELLELLIERGKTDVVLYYDTNLSRLTYKRWDVVKLWSRFPNIWLSLSLDGVGRQGEYIRSGLRFERWVSNLRRVMTEVPHAARTMHFVISVFNILDLPYHYDTIVTSGFVPRGALGFTLLEWPPYLSIQALHPVLKDRVDKRLRHMIETDVLLDESMRRRIETVIAFMRSADLYEAQGSAFVRATRVLDQRRRECALDACPELSMMFENE